MTVYLAAEAENDLRSAVNYIARDDPSAAERLGNRILDVIEELAEGAFDGPAQVLTTGEEVRSWAVPPFRIYYQRHDAAFWVLRIHHQAREPITTP